MTAQRQSVPPPAVLRESVPRLMSPLQHYAPPKRSPLRRSLAQLQTSPCRCRDFAESPYVNTNQKEYFFCFKTKLCPKPGRTSVHAPNVCRPIQIDNYRQFKFGMRRPTHQPFANRAQSQSSLSPTAIHPRRDGGASGNARAPTYAAARPAAAHSLKLHFAPSGASVRRPFTRPFTWPFI